MKYLTTLTYKIESGTNLEPNRRQQASNFLFLLVVVPDAVESLPAALALFWTEILFMLPAVAVTVATVAMTVAAVTVTMAAVTVTMMVMITFLATRNWNEV